MPLSEDYLKSVSESQLKDRAYTPFELDKHERDSIDDIKKSLKMGKYDKKGLVQESLEFVETLANKVNVAINNEKKENKTTWELESDLGEIKKIFEQLNKILMDFEQKIIDETPKKKVKK